MPERKSFLTVIRSVTGSRHIWAMVDEASKRLHIKVLKAGLLKFTKKGKPFRFIGVSVHFDTFLCRSRCFVMPFQRVVLPVDWNAVLHQNLDRSGERSVTNNPVLKHFEI